MNNLNYPQIEVSDNSFIIENEEPQHEEPVVEEPAAQAFDFNIKANDLKSSSNT